MVKIRRDYGSFDVVTELRTAQAAGGDAQSHLEAGRSVEAIVSLNRARASLVKIISIPQVMDVNQAEEAKNYLAIVLDAGRTIARSRADDGVELPTLSIMERLQELDSFLIALEFSLKGHMHVGE